MRAPLFLLGFFSLGLSPAFAQTGGSTNALGSEDLKEQLRDEIKAELRDELVEEIKAEIKSELAQEGVGAARPEADTWAEEEWKWEEPVRPELNFLEFDGYFRFRYDFFHKLGLGIYSPLDQMGAFHDNAAPNVPICSGNQACLNARGDDNSLGGANMRLRLEPTLNVFEDIKIKMQVDVLDNIVLGSTPDGFPASIDVPLLAFSQTQLPPSDGVNALMDAVRVKRVWGEVMTPLGQLRFGRMGSHFGMGVLANEGRGLDSDFGDSADRIMFITKIADHYIAPGFDWSVSGPTSANRGLKQDQPFDRDQRDDVDQYILAIARRDRDEEIKEKLENDELVLNYGTYLVYRTQALDAGTYFKDGDPAAQSDKIIDLVVRDGKAFVASLWLKLLYRKFLFEFEGVTIQGSIGNNSVAGTIASRGMEVDIKQYGGALNAEYKFLQDSLTLSLLVAAASGDSTPGWGARPLLTSPQRGSWDGAQDADGSVSNFRFDPDFQVDLIFWRQLVGMLTDALVIRPGIQYNLTDGLGARLDIVYSRTWFGTNLPASGHVTDPDENIGIEGDLKFFYASDDGFHAWLQYGLFVPFGSLDRAVRLEGQAPIILSAGVAQTIQAMLGIVF